MMLSALLTQSLVRYMLWLILFTALFASLALTPVLALVPSEHPQLITFMEKMESQYGYTRAELENIFASVVLQPSVVAKMKRPAESLPWYKYRKIFLTEENIHNGVKFWRAQAEVLNNMEQKYGVPAEIVVAIIGVETRYGQVKGTTTILDSLVTLMLQYPRRAKFFTSELEQFLLLCKEESLDAKALRGSYAGAMGIPQFIASSYRRYAVDFNGDGVRNLLEQTEDAIGSVGNYLEKHRWRAGQAVAAHAQLADKNISAGSGLNPTLTLADLYAAGLSVVSDNDVHVEIDANVPAMLISLDGEQEKEHWVGFHNFFVITRYNHSKLYAMAVHQLSRKIQNVYAREYGAKSTAE